MKKKKTAIFLCLFLGGIGGHRFYLKQTKTGILYLLFSWTFIPGIISIIDFVKLILIKPEAFDKRYNSSIENN